MLDDEAFATQWLESRDRAHPRGERALRIELRRKGIEPGTTEAALATRRDRAPDDVDADAAAARRLLARSAAALARIPDARIRRQRAYALLARHGFDPDVCGDAVRAIDHDETDPGGAA